jgi:hypothetical protein
MHASDAAALFFPAASDEDEEFEYDTDGGGSGDEQDVLDGLDSRGRSPVDEADQDGTIPVRYLLFLKEKSY